MTGSEHLPGHGPVPVPGQARTGGEEAAARRRRLLAASGDTATERSGDDGDEGWSEPPAAGTERAGSDGIDPDFAERDDELRREVPPHHG
jgi:hypothetical protein